MSLWRGNVDLQYVINEIATVKYVCSYITKGEKGMGETLKRVAKECQNETIRTQMNKIKKEFLGKHVFEAPESTMQVLSMWLIKKSWKVVSVSTSMKDEHVSLVTFYQSQRHNLLVANKEKLKGCFSKYKYER